MLHAGELGDAERKNIVRTGCDFERSEKHAHVG
jgi:hypothetical protein